MFSQAVRLPRGAFGAREVARARELWKLFQEVAVDASVAAGWPPERYLAERTAFIVRTMTVQHHREARYGEALTAQTWVSRVRRGIFCTREVRIQGAQGPLASARQEWVHVTAAIEPARASEALWREFPEENLDDRTVEVPAVARPCASSLPAVFSFRLGWTEMDPLDHANHTAYIGWCEEALAQQLASVGIAPARVVPIAETVTFRRGVTGGREVQVETLAQGHDAHGNAVFSHRIRSGEELCATATTVRALHEEPGESSLVALFLR